MCYRLCLLMADTLHQHYFAHFLRQMASLCSTTAFLFSSPGDMLWFFVFAYFTPVFSNIASNLKIENNVSFETFLQERYVCQRISHNGQCLNKCWIMDSMRLCLYKTRASTGQGSESVPVTRNLGVLDK